MLGRHIFHRVGGPSCPRNLFGEIDTIRDDGAGGIWVSGYAATTESDPYFNYAGFFNGTSWTHRPFHSVDTSFGTAGPLYVAGPDNVWTATARKINHWDGSGWTNELNTSGPGRNLVGLIGWGSDVYAPVSNNPSLTLLYYQGGSGSWSAGSIPMNDPFGSYNITPLQVGFGVDANHLHMMTQSGVSLRSVTVDFSAGYQGRWIWFSGGSSVLWMLGQNEGFVGTVNNITHEPVLEYSPGLIPGDTIPDWNPFATQPPAFGLSAYHDYVPRAAHGVSLSDFWIIATKNTFVFPPVYSYYLSHWNGSAWTDYILPTGMYDNLQLRTIHAVSSADVWIGGSGQCRNTGAFNSTQYALTWHWDGVSWSLVPMPV